MGIENNIYGPENTSQLPRYTDGADRAKIGEASTEALKLSEVHRKAMSYVAMQEELPFRYEDPEQPGFSYEENPRGFTYR
ncbi:MAG: hypothetical protein PHH70_03130 [Candidatus Gracilibacteria bacterium]|nr:hypothetical protein [Candidatus Gracilibacteria bacterium]